MPDARARVTVVPLTVHFGDEEFIDGVTIDHKTFYEKLGKLVRIDGNGTVEKTTQLIFEGLGI